MTCSLAPPGLCLSRGPLVTRRSPSLLPEQCSAQVARVQRKGLLLIESSSALGPVARRSRVARLQPKGFLLVESSSTLGAVACWSRAARARSPLHSAVEHSTARCSLCLLAARSPVHLLKRRLPQGQPSYWRAGARAIALRLMTRSLVPRR